MSYTFSVTPLIAGTAAGRPLILEEPLSLWGGLDPHTGAIIDQRHPQVGQVVTGRVLILPSGRGSSSASSILLEAVREQTAPAAIITAEMDGILTLGAVVAQEIYGHAPPVLVVQPSAYNQLVQMVNETDIISVKDDHIIVLPSSSTKER